MLDDLIGDERSAVAAHEDEAIAVAILERLGEVDNLGHVGEVVERKADRLRAEIGELAVEIAMLKNLEVDNPHLVARGAHRRRNPLHPERFQAQINLAVHQRTRMDEQYPH
jgi:hypothetical protein